MFDRKKKKSKSPPPLQQPRQDDNNKYVYQYTVRDPWQWVISAIATESMTSVEKFSDLPSAKLATNGSPAAVQQHQPQEAPQQMMSGNPLRASSARRRQKMAKERRAALPATLRWEKINAKTGDIATAVHGTSSALDSLEDKDELVRTIQRCRCEHLNLSPPSVLINWDVSEEECKRVLGDALPVLPGNPATYAVLKEPMGSRGEGVFFVKDAEEIHKIISEHRQRAQKEPGFLDKLIAAKGRIPSWVLQAEVAPCLLVKGKHKFHLRSFLVVVENLSHPDILEVFVYKRHEVRMAATPVATDDPSNRDREAHITNGSSSETEKRELLDNIKELTDRNMQDKVETFVASVFGLHLLPDMLGRVKYAASQEGPSQTAHQVRRFAVAAIDMMVCSDDRIYLLEVNVNPSAPPENLVNKDFRNHLTGFMQDLIDLIMEKPYQNFTLARDLLQRKGLLD
ncbi:expressed unknown protein [Seminavis robusta]|uniref:Tubulin--tyrosine ligase n=1 Tax=Seminavis robusta TaxID=568900 RepID=A0A9N8EI40_9STRA|nr:expressed unknown protein [Seminavis robusta]|eukprot:Sro1228_g254400.1 n/a (455) ;mRNA; f:10801-12324